MKKNTLLADGIALLIFLALAGWLWKKLQESIV